VEEHEMDIFHKEATKTAMGWLKHHEKIEDR
jgi:hypothetical protein